MYIAILGTDTQFVDKSKLIYTLYLPISKN